MPLFVWLKIIGVYSWCTKCIQSCRYLEVKKLNCKITSLHFSLHVCGFKMSFRIRTFALKRRIWWAKFYEKRISWSKDTSILRISHRWHHQSSWKWKTSWKFLPRFLAAKSQNWAKQLRKTVWPNFTFRGIKMKHFKKWSNGSKCICSTKHSSTSLSLLFIEAASHWIFFEFAV